jgi:hypothetical protein
MIAIFFSSPLPYTLDPRPFFIAFPFLPQPYPLNPRPYLRRFL